jgi:hypothetical protein
MFDVKEMIRAVFVVILVVMAVVAAVSFVLGQYLA